jgi:hypothetical protein
MTPEAFRRLALSLPDAIEMEHMDHPDFRVGGKIFATLGYPNETRGMVKLMPDQQQDYIRLDSAAFTPVAGKWGEKGCTHVILRAAKTDLLRKALRTAWENAQLSTSSKRKTKPQPDTKRTGTAAKKGKVLSGK